MADSPREAIIRDLTRPPGRPARLSIPHPAPRSGMRSVVYRGGHPFQARPETIRILKERRRGRRALVAVEFEDTAGNQWRYVCGAISGNGPGWEAQGAAGGSGSERDRAEPWANFGGWGWPRFMCIGGTVHGPVHHVRLVDARGVVVDEDTVDDRVALMMTDEPVQQPSAIELYGTDGRLLRSQSWPPD